MNCVLDVQDQAVGLHSLALVRSCVQKAVGMLRDPSGVVSRSMERIHTLLTLLGNGQDDTNGNITIYFKKKKVYYLIPVSCISNNAFIHSAYSKYGICVVARFHQGLLGRLTRALAQQEEAEVSPAEWLNAEARKRQALQEGGTLR